MIIVRASVVSTFLIAFLTAHPAFAAFSDVPAVHPYAEAIAYIQAQGIVSGYPDGTFRPDQTINRAEFVKIIMNADRPEEIPSQCGRSDAMYLPFSDVGNADWFALRLCMAASRGVVSGYPDGTFRPTETINIVEAGKILHKTFENRLPVVPSMEEALQIATDAYGSEIPWYIRSLFVLEAYFILPGSIQAEIKQDHQDYRITRGEMAEMIYRIMHANFDADADFAEKALPDARDAQRKADVEMLANVIMQYGSEHPGWLVATIPSVATELCAKEADRCGDTVDLRMLIPQFLTWIPSDPLLPYKGNSTGYFVEITSNNRLLVTAPSAEKQEISALRNF